MESSQNNTKTWYKNYYQKKGKDRNDLLTNPEVLFQYLAFESAIISALGRAENINRRSSKILDVGCGAGGSLARFMQLGFLSENLFGIDIIHERIDEAKHVYPNLNFICHDAVSMPFESDFFDIVLESTMFVQITDEKVSCSIAEEMLRVTKPGEYILLVDWRYGKPFNYSYLAVSKKRICRMFSVGSLSEIIFEGKGALVPPIGRAISKYLPSTYFLLQALFPFLVGLKVTLLRKK